MSGQQTTHRLPAGWKRHLHCLLVWLQKLAGELAQDGEVGDVRRGLSLWLLNGALEYKLDAIPVQGQVRNEEGVCGPLSISATPAQSLNRGRALIPYL